MIVLYAGGQRLGTWAEAEPLFLEAMRRGPVEFCDEVGFVLTRTERVDPLIPWDPTITREELDRRSREGGGIPLAEFWKRLGVE